MNIQYDNSLSVTDYNNLRKSAGWGAYPKKQAQEGINNSAFLVAAKSEGKTIGMARAITDGGCVAFILDVAILPEYQGKGIGKTMLQMLLTYLKGRIAEDETMYVGLMASKGKEGFYKQFGFTERPNEAMGAGMIQWINGEPT